jgi:hypothetical protein
MTPHSSATLNQKSQSNIHSTKTSRKIVLMGVALETEEPITRAATYV